MDITSPAPRQRIEFLTTHASPLVCAHQFTCRDSYELGPATMFCESAWPSDATSRWVLSSYTKFGKELQSLETYTDWVVVDDHGTMSRLTVTTSGPVLASALRGPGAILWGMAVLITSTSSSSPGDTTATAEHNDSNAGAVASNTSQVASITSQAAGSRATSPATTTATAAPRSAGGFSTGVAVGIGVAAGAAALLMVLGGWLLYRRGVAKGRTMSGAIEKQQKEAKEPAGHENITTLAAAAAEWSSQYHQYHQPYHSYNHDVHRRPCELEPTPPAPRELE
ncbi:hypothetical protein LA080_009140 [Diaporthe eres]|nr:hypothetical protein LA080_009140 [Diaporthe eres]